MVYFWQQFLNVSTDFQIKMVKMLKILVRGDEIELLPFSFEKPQYADIPKTKEYTSENEHTLFANKSNAEIGSENQQIEEKGQNNEKEIEERGEGNEKKRSIILKNIKKSRKYFGKINIKKAICFERLMKKLQKEDKVKSYCVKVTKKGNPILYLNCHVYRSNVMYRTAKRQGPKLASVL